MMTYNRVNNSISEAYTSIYNKSQKRYITEKAEDRDSLNGSDKKYRPLLRLLELDENGKKFLHAITKDFDDNQLLSFVSALEPSIVSIDADRIPSHDKMWVVMLNHFYSPGKWGSRPLRKENVKDFFKLLNSQEIVDKVKNALDTNIEIPVYQDSTAAINGDSPDNNNTGNKGQKTKTTSDGKTTPNEQAKKVTIPDNIDSDTINYYKGELDKIAKKSMRLRERILTIIRLQSEYIERFRNQNANQSAQYQQQATGNGGYVTKGTVFSQGQQNPNTHQHVQPQQQQQPQQPQQQPQNTPKQDEEEDGIFSKAMKGLGKAVGGVVGGGADIGSAALDAGKSGLGYLKRGADYLMGK